MPLTQPNDQANRRLMELSDLDRLWFAQFGQSREVVARVLCVTLAAVGLWLYDGGIAGPIWACVYLGGLWMSYHTMQPADQSRPLAWYIGMGSHLVIALGFAWLPIYLITVDDMVLNFCGFLGMVGLGAFTLFREEPPDVVQPLDVVIGWAALAIVAYRFVPEAPSLAAQLVMGFLCIVVAGYYALALLTTRSIRKKLRDAAELSHETREMEAVGRLSGGMAHDFNNILTALQGSLELYHVVPEGQERDALVDEARAAGVRASALVAQLLSFARRAPLEPKPIDANGVLEEMRDMALRLVPDGARLEMRTLEEPALAMADPTGLREALLHLIVNANEAVEGRGTITLAVDRVSGPAEAASGSPVLDHDVQQAAGAHLSFSVADDGPGMSDDVARRAVEPFFSTKPRGKGSGLGLSMAMGFAEQSGGALRIRTSASGTTVAVHLPMAEGTSADT